MLESLLTFRYLNILPFTQDLKELAIENVIPNFNKDTNLLEYHFDMLPSGITYEKNN